MRLAALSESSVEAFLVVNMLTGMPLIALLMSWSIWYGVRSFRRSEEWGPAIRALEELEAQARRSPNRSQLVSDSAGRRAATPQLPVGWPSGRSAATS